MTSEVEMAMPINFSESAANQVKGLMADEDPNMKLRVYVTGGGCSGFSYGFTFDEKINEGDTQIEKNGVTLIVDSMSLQYLVGGTVDYTSGLDGSRFFVDNPNATATCGCGSSFSI
ncbi:iron-sulfur cluster insertion protein ErpA [Psychromonas sp. psych-6C06]|uniref:iron-sulfur cluster insertion protein ErpA n=1 Tax=Psychromonas sp. psych-6C06 TaxID=2058089 RepID=UPI000C33861F|nr:iron-sulfur cluster insertion protein ErpA [Psychromonas sp. psych-6C06]PKF60474.1 iron-sulfur cluster insertion protein ErpA [Psychromonas sp. psych-6C06]